MYRKRICATTGLSDQAIEQTMDKMSDKIVHRRYRLEQKSQQFGITFGIQKKGQQAMRLAEWKRSKVSKFDPDGCIVDDARRVLKDTRVQTVVYRVDQRRIVIFFGTIDWTDCCLFVVVYQYGG